jgi:hypothetical protein
VSEMPGNPVIADLLRSLGWERMKHKTKLGADQIKYLGPRA